MLVLSEKHNVSFKKRCRMHSAQCLGPWPILMVSLPRLTRLNSSISWKMTMAMKTSHNWKTTFTQWMEMLFCKHLLDCLKPLLSLQKKHSVPCQNFVTDTYKEDSIKSIEHKKVGNQKLSWWKDHQQDCHRTGKLSSKNSQQRKP